MSCWLKKLHRSGSIPYPSHHTSLFPVRLGLSYTQSNLQHFLGFRSCCGHLGGL